MLVKVCKPSPAESEARRSEVQGHLWLHNEFKVHLGNMRPCQIIKYSLPHGLASKVSNSWTLTELPVGGDEVCMAQQLWSAHVVCRQEKGVRDTLFWGEEKQWLVFLLELMEML